MGRDSIVENQERRKPHKKRVWGSVFDRSPHPLLNVPQTVRGDQKVVRPLSPHEPCG